MFSQPIIVRWADLDPNGHVRHSVYYDWGAMVRVTYLHQHGVGLAWMTRNAIGPVLFREEARFTREVRFGDDLSIDVQLAAASVDGRKFRMRHRIMRGADLVATIEVDGAWLDLKARKVAAPPPELAAAFADMTRTDDFTELTSGKPGGQP
jgi:acyl-CoA thioester hydrolase